LQGVADSARDDADGLAVCTIRIRDQPVVTDEDRGEQAGNVENLRRG
jgi:hypothetical protein